MEKSILKLGIALNKAKQKSIQGKGPVYSLRACECGFFGVVKFQPCDWHNRHISCG
ncbi:hypothetical protein [uncultured Tenacibaculum sp.]|uniref:hypothetical protein n=1 Tax=uncultured Tenacibaculum sp. TaxID=174713 RepID=UPI00262A218E|nr:hypothetical protein [uncultured Tenacibaculum sp.]